MYLTHAHGICNGEKKHQLCAGVLVCVRMYGLHDAFIKKMHTVSVTAKQALCACVLICVFMHVDIMYRHFRVHASGICNRGK